MGDNSCLWSDLEHKRCPGIGCGKNMNAKLLACELWVKRVGTSGVILYCYQQPLGIFLYNIWVVLLDTKLLCLEIIFSNIKKSK